MAKVTITLEDAIEDGDHVVKHSYVVDGTIDDGRDLVKSSVGLGLAIKHLILNDVIQGLVPVITENIQFHAHTGGKEAPSENT